MAVITRIYFVIGRTLHCTLFRRNLRTVFEFKGETDNIIKFSCFLCLPRKNVSPFANSLSNLRQHVECKNGIVQSTFLFFLILLYDTGRTLHRYHARVCGFRSGVTRTIENVVLLLS